ncbi:MAG: hypothetical protein ACOYOJ_20330 [Alsobacter sp.]
MAAVAPAGPVASIPVPGRTVSQIVGKIGLQPAASAAASSSFQARSIASAWAETAAGPPERIAAWRADLDDLDLGIGQQRAQALHAERADGRRLVEAPGRPRRDGGQMLFAGERAGARQDGRAQSVRAFLQVTDRGATVGQFIDRVSVHNHGSILLSNPTDQRSAQREALNPARGGEAEAPRAHARKGGTGGNKPR